MQLSKSVSIIIPCKGIDAYTKDCIKHCLLLDYQDYEIIVLPDRFDEVIESIERIRVIPTGALTPGAKRNIGIATSEKDFCAFIDADAYPRTDWLTNAIRHFENGDVDAVGGPGVTPDDDNIAQRASGYVLSSFMVGGLSNRYRANRIFKSNDIHSCNFIARRTTLIAIGGWNEKFWPGEDTLICLSLWVSRKRMIEASDVVVYHHRRPLFGAHLKQVSRFGLHRGFFARRFGGNSLKIGYFMPSIFILSAIIGLAISIYNDFVATILLSAVALYLILGLIASVLETKDTSIVPLVFLGIITSHITYGIFFLIGLAKSDLKK